MYNKKESTEDYLESILMAQKEFGSIRAIDLAKYMGFSKPSISIALKKLKENNFVIIDNQTGNIILTEEGNKIAELTLEKHELLTKAFMNLGVSKETSEQDACKIEHLLSEETYAAIKKHFKAK